MYNSGVSQCIQPMNADSIARPPPQQPIVNTTMPVDPIIIRKLDVNALLNHCCMLHASSGLGRSSQLFLVYNDSTYIPTYMVVQSHKRKFGRIPRQRKKTNELRLQSYVPNNNDKLDLGIYQMQNIPPYLDRTMRSHNLYCVISSTTPSTT